MNGFTAVDMSTAAANGHAEGYQAGYADAVKAFEAGKPAAAQEAVVWGIRIGDSDSWGYTNNEEQADFLGKQSGLPYEKKPLYAAPVAAAPVELSRLARFTPSLEFGSAQMAGDASGDYVFLDDVRELLSSIPAAPVDLPIPRSREEFIKAIEGMSVSVDVDRLFDTDGRRLFGTVTEAMWDRDDKHNLTLLVQDAEPNWEASTPAAPVVDPSRLGAAMKAFDDACGHAVSYAPAWMRKALEAASAPAAQRIDVEQIVSGLKGIADFDTHNDCTSGEGHSNAIYKARELLALIDASPKGGSTDENNDLLPELRDVEDYFTSVDPNPIHLATVRQAINVIVGSLKGGSTDAQDAARWRYVRRKLCLTGNGNGTCSMQAINLPASIHGWPEPGEVADFCDIAIDSAMQATSAEVGE